MANLPHRARGVKVLKAVSSPLRLQILNLLFDKNALSYTELMNELKMNPSRDAGRFAYHLKFLLKADLVEADAEAKKYFLTDLGKMVIDVADRVEKKAVKPRGMLVRTSHFTLEEFDANKISNSLIKEAKVPPEIAQKAAKQAEKRLLKSKTKYLTAPLIREVVNAILVEKGFEDYRHKLTRLGMPVHEVTALADTNTTQNSEAKLSAAGNAVFSEYTLLNVFPRDIADAHASGALHIEDLGTWIMKPKEIMHDLRFFLQNGIKPDNPLQLSTPPPNSLESALSTTFNMLLHTSKETSGTQTCSYFNVFLAPYAKGVDATRIKESLRLFILNLNQHANATLGLELTVPTFIADKPAIGPQGKTIGKYADFVSETQLLASLIIEVFMEESIPKPLLNPTIVIKIGNDALADQNAKPILLKAHALAIATGTPNFAAKQKEKEAAVFSASGLKLTPDLTGDWETDTLRTGCLGTVTINLPRIAHECEKDKNKFFEILRERCEMATRALGIKYNALKQRGKHLLPFMLQTRNGDTYFRLENCTRAINFAGYKETVETLIGKNITDEENTKFTEEIAQNIAAFRHKIGRKHGKRLYPAMLRSPEASERLAQLDMEKYGVAKVKFSGTREKPYYSTSKRLSLKAGDFLCVPSEQLDAEMKLKGLSTGGSLSIIELGEADCKPEELLSLTAHLVVSQALEFFTYNRVSTYCGNCRKSWFGTLHKCPSCGSMSTLTVFNRFAFT
ncbi:ArsR family transcriptional regulator [Candidatus Bathyarchaeota archaeon A05DMB-2]|nr:ArsR family transcriptional regulator [Candidatus Bathyarchaeota archaeon A05DMB-2]